MWETPAGRGEGRAGAAVAGTRCRLVKAVHGVMRGCGRPEGVAELEAQTRSRSHTKQAGCA